MEDKNYLKFPSVIREKICSGELVLPENALKFPRPNKKIAVGNIYAEAGPAEVNESTGHVCWWLYENIEIEGFSIC